MKTDMLTSKFFFTIFKFSESAPFIFPPFSDVNVVNNNNDECFGS